jgi:hypothetical protein
VTQQLRGARGVLMGVGCFTAWKKKSGGLHEMEMFWPLPSNVFIQTYNNMLEKCSKDSPILFWSIFFLGFFLGF